MTRVLRDYQREAVEAIEKEWANGVVRTGIRHATGLGKSSIIGHIATEEAKAGGRTLILAHRGELLDQITDACTAFDPSIPVGRIQAHVDERDDPITVAMTPTLGGQRRRDRLPRYTKVIIDECHHAAAPREMAILAHVGCFTDVPLLGVTATMVREGRYQLGDVFQSVAHDRDIAWAVEHGWLVRPHGRVVALDHLDLANAKISKGDYQDGQLGEMVAQDVDQIVAAWIEHARRPDGAHRRTAAFFPTVDSARAAAQAFRVAGVACSEVYGTTPTTERSQIYADLASAAISVLCGVMVTSEGWDCPPVEAILMARPTQRPGLYAQIVGRGLRPSPATGKTDCLVLDVVGASRVNRLVTLIELLPSAVVVQRPELCQVCGGWRHGEPPCSCPPERREQGEGPTKLLGPAQYEDLDLFASSQLNWLFTRGGKRFLPAGDRIAVLWPDSDDPAVDVQTYSAGHCTVRGRQDGRWVVEHVELHEARAAAESWAMAYDSSLSRRTASWRGKLAPSSAQLSMARSMRISDAATMTKARLSDEISIVVASRRLD